MLIPSDSHNNYNRPITETEDFLQSALDALSAHIAILDENGTIIGINAAWRHFADLNNYNDPTYGIGTNYLAVCDASAKLKSRDAIVVADGIRNIVSGKVNDFQLEYPCHSPTTKRWFVLRVSRFDWYDNIRVIVAHQNVSELKRVQVELSESKQRIEAIIDNVNNGIITINAQGLIETANRASARIFGYQVDELIDLHLEDIMTERFTDETSFHRLNGQHGHEIIGIRKDGGQFPMYFSLNRLQLDNTVIYTCIIQDITYRKRMEREIIERERMQIALDKERELRTLKNRFLSMMGHELNTPLASISLAYDMLKKYGDVSTPEENEQALDNIQQQVGYLRDMVKDVMTLSRSEAEGLSIDIEQVNLVVYCQDIVDEFDFIYSQTHSIVFRCELKKLLTRIDRRMLRRALTNLLSNAIKYSPAGKSVILSLNLDKANNIIITVKDAGRGIPQEDHERLFEPFHRATNVDGVAGTGLGLAIVKQAVDLHNGTITFETALNEGTTFIIRMPLSNDETIN
ncbi:MAG: PAS domain-containing sensor histidine kinase [Phototrophicaceae bacterium]